MANLLDQASIVLTPTAYDNGKVLCAKPVDGSGDFDFSRNSAATRVNAQGLVEDVQILSSNLVQNGSFSQLGSEEITNGNFSQQGSQLVTNGDFATDTNWTLGNGSNISGGSLLMPDGGTALQTISAANTNVKFVIEGVGDVRYRLNTGVGFTTISLPQTIYTTTGASGSRVQLINSSGSDTTIDNVSVVEVGQDWTFSSGATLTDLGAKITHTPTAGQISQQFIVIGKQYKFTYEITESVVGGLKLNSAINTSMVTSVGIHTKYFEADATGFTIARTSAINNDVTITNISVKEVGQNWTLGTDWSIGENKAIRTGTTSSGLTQSGTFNNGNKYKLEFTISDYVSGSIKGEFVGGGGSDLFFTNNNIGNGTFSFITETTTNRSLLQFYVFSNFIGSITNISVIEITDDTNLPRINYEGFSYQDALGSEQIVNGDFSNGSTDWGTGTGWSISGGTANGLATLDPLRQEISGFTAGKKYKVSFEITELINGFIRVYSYVGASGTFTQVLATPSQIGTYEVIFEFGGTNKNLFFYGNAGGGNFTGSIDNVSVKEYLGQEVVPDSGCGSWLFEPQSTNLITYSEDFSQSYWSTYGSEVSRTLDASQVNPSGTNGSYILKGVSGLRRFGKTLSVTPNTDYTISFYVKNINATFLKLLLTNSSVSSEIYTSEVSTTKWSRVEVSFTSGAATSTTIQILRDLPIGESVYIWGVQLEQQSYATSYIPTDGTSVTRNQDVCTNGGSVASINSTEGVLYAEIAALDNDGTIRFLGLNDGSSNNRVVLLYHNSNNNIRAIISSGGTKFVDVNSSVTSSLDFHKVAIKYKANDFALWIDGVEVATDTSLNAPIGLNSLDFLLSGANNFFGKTKALAVWKEALSDEELAELTTI